MTNYQTEIQSLDSLDSELKDSKKRLKQETSKLSTFPPLWNGEIQDLKNFTTELKDWLDDPKLKKVKDIIREFQGICGDKREFRFGENTSYYISILDVLRQGKEILSDITNDDINKEAARIILNQVIQQNKEELEGEINKIKEYWAKFNEKITNFDTKNDAFIEEVKKDSIEKLIKSLKVSFDSDEVNSTYRKIEKAKESRELLKEIDSNAFLSEYDKNKDIDGIWNISDTVRKKLNATDVDTAGIPKDTNRKNFSISSGLLSYINSRDEALKESNLTEIEAKLDELFGKLKRWSKKVKGFIEGDIKRLDTWLTAIKNSQYNESQYNERIQDMTVKITDLRQKFNLLRFDNVKEIKTKELYDTFEEYYALKKEIKEFFKHLLGEDAREVLDNLSNLEKIRNDMGNKFWEATKELCDTFPQLKIKMEWSKGQ